MRYSARRNAIPRSVGAMRKTFGRSTGSTRPTPPWYVMPIGRSASAAIRQEALTPVPSSTIATAPSASARRTFPTAVLRREARVVALDAEAVRALIRVHDLRSRPRARRRRRSSRPTYGVREKGALTAMRSVLSALFESLPPQAGRQAAEDDQDEQPVQRTAHRARGIGGPGRRHARPRSRRPRRGFRTRSACPAASTVTSSATRRTKRRLCSISRSARPFAAQRLEQVHEAIELDRRSAGGRLVQQEHTRLGGKRRGQHEQPLARGADSSAAGRPRSSSRPTSSSAPSARRSAFASSARACGVRKSVRKGPERRRRRPAPTRACSSTVRSGKIAVVCWVPTTPRRARSRWGDRLQPVALRGRSSRSPAAARPTSARQRGCLARPVRPDQRMHRARPDVEVEVVERDEALEALREPACGQRLRALSTLAAARPCGRRNDLSATAPRCLDPPAARRRQKPDSAQSEDEQQAVAVSISSSRPGGSPRSAPTCSASMRERGDERGAPRRGRARVRDAADDDGDEEREREDRPVRRRVGDLRELDRERSRETCDRGRGRERSEPEPRDGDAEARARGRGARAPPRAQGRAPGGRGRRTRSTASASEHDAELVVRRRRQRPAEDTWPRGGRGPGRRRRSRGTRSGSGRRSRSGSTC